MNVLVSHVIAPKSEYKLLCSDVGLLPSLPLFFHLSLCISWGKSRTAGRVFFGAGMGSEGKRQRRKKASIQSPIILYSWSPMCLYYLKHSPSRESSILSHCEAIIWGAISTEAKIVLFVKYWLSKMGPQGFDGREYQIPHPTSYWWIMFVFSRAPFPHLLDIITQALDSNCQKMQTVMYHLSAWKCIIMLI